MNNRLCKGLMSLSNLLAVCTFEAGLMNSTSELEGAWLGSDHGNALKGAALSARPSVWPPAMLSIG